MAKLGVCFAIAYLKCQVGVVEVGMKQVITKRFFLVIDSGLNYLS